MTIKNFKIYKSFTIWHNQTTDQYQAGVNPGPFSIESKWFKTEEEVKMAIDAFWEKNVKK